MWVFKTQSLQMSNNEQTELFLALYSGEQQRLYTHIRTMILNKSDADEIFQDVCLVLWHSFDDYVQGTNFSAWARQIARHRVLAFFKKKKGEKLHFSEEVVAKVSQEFSEVSPVLESRSIALVGCMEKLTLEDRELIDRRYQLGVPTAEIADEQNKPTITIYKKLSRIRKSLLACINRALMGEDLVS